MAQLAKMAGSQNPAQLHPNWPVPADQTAAQSLEEAGGHDLATFLHRMAQASASQASAAPAQTEAAGPPGPQNMIADAQKLYELMSAADPATVSLLLAAQMRDSQGARGPVTDRQADPAAALSRASPAVAATRPADVPVAPRCVITRGKRHFFFFESVMSIPGAFVRLRKGIMNYSLPVHHQSCRK